MPLGHRELAPAEAEPLAVVRHQVDAGQVGLRLRSPLGEGGDHRVAVGAVGELHRRRRTSCAARRRGLGAAAPTPSIAPSALARRAPRPRARAREQLVQPLELRDSERGRDSESR